MVIKRRRHLAKARLSAKRKSAIRRRAKKIAFSMKAPMKAYRTLEGKIDKTWTKLRQDVKTRSRKAIVKGRRDLLLLLGECNYMARECGRCLKGKKRR